MELWEKTISREKIFEGRVFTVAKDKSQLADGSVADRELVLHAGGAGILPVDNDGNITLVRQYRCGVSRVMTEICAGKMEQGEDPRACALRELEEELGFIAGEVTSLGYLTPTPAYDSELTYIFLARNLTVTDAHLDEGEFLERVTMPLCEAVKMVMSGELTDAKTQIAVLKAERIINGEA